MAVSYVFDKPKSLATVCGSNDGNITYIENLLGVSIAVRGNRIECINSNPDTEECLVKLLDRLVQLSEITDDISQPEILMEYKSVQNSSLNTNPGRKHINVGTKSVYPKSSKQEDYIRAMEEKQVIFAIGPAGTGKTFLAVNYSLGKLFSGKISKIILTRPVVEAGENLGFLPGDLSQKLNPYLKPLYDSMEATVSPATVKRLEETNQIEIAPLAYMRGRSINNACVILDEAQNTTPSQMKMFLTRLGENSIAIITGDITQIDLPKNQSSGLMDALNRLEDVEGVAFIRFSGRDTVRSRIVQRIIDAYEEKQ